jgi:acetyl-CoA acetyltransferase
MARENRDVVFVDGVRTPFGKAGSMYAETRADDLVVDCIRELQRCWLDCRDPYPASQSTGCAPEP